MKSGKTTCFDRIRLGDGSQREMTTQMEAWRLTCSRDTLLFMRNLDATRENSQLVLLFCVVDPWDVGRFLVAVTANGQFAQPVGQSSGLGSLALVDGREMERE